MRLLVLGGSQFLGRAIVDEACSRGYDVTTFSRGRSGHHRPGTETLTGDRTNPDDLRQLARGEWDAVIDTSVLAPAHVAASAQNSGVKPALASVPPSTMATEKPTFTAQKIRPNARVRSAAGTRSATSADAAGR